MDRLPPLQPERAGGSPLDSLAELRRKIEQDWTPLGGIRTATIDRLAIEEIDQNFPLPKPGMLDDKLPGRAIATVMLALETAGKIPSLKRVREMRNMQGNEGEPADFLDLLTLAAAGEGITEAVLTRQIVYEKVVKASTTADKIGGYDQRKRLRERTEGFNSTNVGVLAIIDKMHRQSLIGSVTRGRAEAIIRLMLPETQDDSF